MIWLLLIAVFAGILIGIPVFIALSGISLLVAVFGATIGVFDLQILSTVPARLFGVITNTTLLAVPLFVLMGVILQQSDIAKDLLRTLERMTHRLNGGLAVSVLLVGGILAASTGIVGATVVTLGLLVLPTMLRLGYDKSLSMGLIAATGTLGQIIPPSIALVILGDVLSSSYQQAQLSQGIFNPDTVSIGHLFFGAVGPGVLLLVSYIAYVLIRGALQPQAMPHQQADTASAIDMSSIYRDFALYVVPPLGLMVVILGSILSGLATPTEAAGVGVVAAILICWSKGKLNVNMLRASSEKTVEICGMIFAILMAATIFSLVFRGYGGDEVIGGFVHELQSPYMALLLVMTIIFVLGFFLDFIEIVFVVLPILCPPLLAQGIDPVWLGVLVALNLQTSFITPPFGFALFYLRGVAPESYQTKHIYAGAIPFVLIQLLVLATVVAVPELATWIPDQLFD